LIPGGKNNDQISRAELLEMQLKVREDFQGEIDAIKEDLVTINERLLPVGKWLENIESHTVKMTVALDKQSDAQEQIMAKLYDQEMKIQEIQSNNSVKKEKLRVKGAVLISVISLFGAGSGIGMVVGKRLTELLFGN
jgi:hypothetical protein